MKKRKIGKVDAENKAQLTSVSSSVWVGVIGDLLWLQDLHALEQVNKVLRGHVRAYVQKSPSSYQPLHDRCVATRWKGPTSDECRLPYHLPFWILWQQISWPHVYKRDLVTMEKAWQQTKHVCAYCRHSFSPGAADEDATDCQHCAIWEQEKGGRCRFYYLSCRTCHEQQTVACRLCIDKV